MFTVRFKFVIIYLIHIYINCIFLYHFKIFLISYIYLFFLIYYYVTNRIIIQVLTKHYLRAAYKFIIIQVLDDSKDPAIKVNFRL